MYVGLPLGRGGRQKVGQHKGLCVTIDRPDIRSESKESQQCNVTEAAQLAFGGRKIYARQSCRQSSQP